MYKSSVLVSAFVVVCAVILSGCVGGTSNVESSSGGVNVNSCHDLEKNGNYDTNHAYNTVREIRKCFLEVAVKTDDGTVCSEAGSDFVKNSCWEHFAISKLDSSLCKNSGRIDWMNSQGDGVAECEFMIKNIIENRYYSEDPSSMEAICMNKAFGDMAQIKAGGCEAYFALMEAEYM